MNIPLFWAVLGLMGAAYLWIGQASSKGLQNSDDYYLMGRKLSFLPLSLTLLATQLGGGTLLGAAQEAYLKGWVVFFYPLGVCLGLLILGMGFGAKLRRLNLTTVAELFERVYGSRSQRRIASILSIAGLFFILVAQAIAARQFFVSLGVLNPAFFYLFWGVLVTYTVMGGLKAVVNTDVLQAVFILATLALAFFCSSEIGPVELQTAAVTPLSEVPWTAWLLMPLCFMLIEQDMGQRCFAAKTPRTVSLSALAAGLLLLLGSSVAMYFGVRARELGITVSEGQSILIEAVGALTNPTVSTLFAVAVLMTVISTADSLLCSISSNLSCDLLGEDKMSRARLVTLGTGLAALGVSVFFGNVVEMLILSYELSVCVLFVPVMAAVLAKQPCRQGAYGAMALGALAFLLFRCVETPLPRELLCVALSATGYLAGKLLPAGRLVEVTP